MAEHWNATGDPFEQPALRPQNLRLFAIWGGSALAAAVLFAGSLYMQGDSQQTVAVNEPVKAVADTPRGTSSSLQSHPFDAELEARRLSEAIRMLAADRDRLQARIKLLERNFDDVTGSITANAAVKSNPAASPLPPANDLTMGASVSGVPTAVLPVTEPARPKDVTPPLTQSPPQTQPASGRISAAFAAAKNDADPASSIATKTDFGIDLGSAATIDAVRALWIATRNNHEQLFEGLRPVVAIRENANSGMELRLIAGPLANAGAAARLCAALSAANITCQPAVFDGQRLALR
ncbi:MAG TPA: hypothetical protein VHN11_04450 [Xanthobacteraceae bacterium]|jgi:hypothetical protein|nr:hypothetical protein [Xanthobacteraceae bacterium]